MAIFSRKNKPKKGDEKSKQPEPTEDKPKSEPYRHVPKHAASDAVTIGLTPGDRRDEQQRIMAASQQRLSNNKPDFATKNPPFSRADSHYAMHSTPSPSSYAGQQRQSFASTKSYGTQGMSNGVSEIPPRAVSPILNTDRNGQIGRNPSDYFVQRDNPSPSFDSPTLGNPKTQLAPRDRGYGNPHLSSDSGYGSAAQSRAPSEVNAPQEAGPSRPSRSTGGFLPELSLSEELAQELAFSERSFLQDPPLELPLPGKTRQRTSSNASNASNYVSRLDPGADTTSLKLNKSIGSTKSAKSTTKQARFEEPAEPVPKVPVQYERRSSQTKEPRGREQRVPEDVAQSRNRYVQNERSFVHSAAASEEPEPSYAQQAQHSTPPLQNHEEPRPPFSQPTRASTPPSTYREPAPQPQFAAPARNSTPPLSRRPGMDNYSSSQLRYSTPAPQAQYPPLELVTSPASSKRSTLPPLTILDGFKVNKRGKILDEEGDPIGELVEGDIIDCVRHKANAYGEVLDDFGGVVGHVRTIPRGVNSPMARSASPALAVYQQQHEHQTWYRPESMQNPISPVQASQDRSSAYHQPEPQQYFHQNREQEHIVSPRPYSLPQTSMSSLEHPLNITRVELDGSGHAEAPPMIDHSEIFAVPFIPSRSLKRASPPYPDYSRNTNEQNQLAEEDDQETAPTEHTPRRWASRNFEFEDDDEEPTPRQRTPQPAEPTPAPAPVQSQIPRSIQQQPPRSSTPKSALRPAMGSMPEDSVPESLPDENPALYSYRGEIPAADGPAADSRVIPPQKTGAKPAPLPSFPRQAFTSSLPAGSPFAPMNSAQFSSAGGMGSRRATTQFSTGVPGPRPILANNKNSYHQPLRKSPLASQGKSCMISSCQINTDDQTETTPPESEGGNSDDGRTPQPPGSTSRAGSVRTMNSTATAKNTKPRAYFTHGGRVTVNGGQPPPSQNALNVPGANDPKPDASSMKSGKSSGSKKSRFSFGFGKKEQPVSAF